MKTEIQLNTKEEYGMNNHNAKVIDELGERMEEALDNNNLEEWKTLKSFYDWYVENFIL